MLEHIGKYKVLEKIGQGAMGEVYKAHDPILNRFVAVKTISAELGGDDTLRSALQGWIDSPAHCENLMEPQFTQVAVACVGKPGSQWGTYWTMLLGRR